ncbi:hypothetical protein [Clostridium felsineum]|uniref:hypothetical protein n=1 Tax=Clostridium felsineum TaxID=36839 RepID=UPI00098C8626|nr:hypothetical protein [Clostridium felsineum]URZ00528.1 hypothetical protein CLAUR_005160 [Clostridium felsineum]
MLKDGLNKAKIIYFIKGILSAIAVVSILSSFIVNLSVNHYLSWFYIVACSEILAGVFIGILIFKKENKIISAIASLSIMIIPFFLIIEKVVNKYFLNSPVFWVKKYALPITSVWLVVIWIGIFAFKKFKINILFCFTIIFILAIPASMVTNQLANRNNVKNVFADNCINTLCYGILAILSLIIGILIKFKNNNSNKL